MTLRSHFLYLESLIHNRYSHSSLYRFNLHLLVLMNQPHDTVWLGLATCVRCITVFQLRTLVQQCHFQMLGIPSHTLQMFRKGKYRVERNPQARVVMWQQQAAEAAWCLFAHKSVGKSDSSSCSTPGSSFPSFSHFCPEVPRSPHTFFRFHLIIQVPFVPRYSRQSLHCLWSWSKTSGTRHWAGKLGAEVAMNS